MGKLFCTYHPTVPASWYCDSCDAYYCSDCISQRDLGGSFKGKGTILYLCPKCSCPSEKLAVQNVMEPFWNRMPAFFTYPFTLTVVTFMLGISVLWTLCAILAQAGALIPALLMSLFLVMAQIKFWFAVLKETAQGNMLPPEIDTEMLTGDISIVVKYVVLFLLLGILTGVFSAFCMQLAFATSPYVMMAAIALYAIALAFALPAMIIVLATSRGLLKALNPWIYLRVASRIGKSYFLMYFLLLLLWCAPGLVAYFVKPFLPEILFIFIVSLANLYYAIIAHHLMGYVVLQHHEDIGYEVDVDDTGMERISGHARTRDAGQALLNRVNILIKDGRYGEAVKLVQEETGGDPGSLELAERFHNLLKMTRKTPEMLEHAGKYLDLLIKARKESAYRALYLECAAADPKFNPKASSLFRVASALSESGDDQAALAAYNRFIKACPEDPMAPKAYLMAATIFHEKLHDPDRAAKILRKLIQTYPEHEVAGYAGKYLRRLGQGG